MRRKPLTLEDHAELARLLRSIVEQCQAVSKLIAGKVLARSMDRMNRAVMFSHLLLSNMHMDFVREHPEAKSPYRESM